METTLLLARPNLPLNKFAKNPSLHARNRRVIRRNLVVVKAEQGDNEEKSMDENMIVLKLRIIKKPKLLEAKSNQEKADTPTISIDWKEWEKKLFSHYHKDVCEVVEWLQSYLMNTRPSVALGILALVTMAVPLSTPVAFTNVLRVAKGLLAGCHMCIDIDF